MNPLRKLQDRLNPLRAEILSHSVYSLLTDLASLRIFMQHHVFVVWDFMPLLKAIQSRLSSVQAPWLPRVNQLGCRLINEIALAE